jgi:hypothetical protein
MRVLLGHVDDPGPFVSLRIEASLLNIAELAALPFELTIASALEPTALGSKTAIDVPHSLWCVGVDACSGTMVVQRRGRLT